MNGYDFIKMFASTIDAKLCEHTIDVAYEHYLDSQEEETIREALKTNSDESEDIQIVKSLLDKFGLKRFQEIILKAIK